MGGGAAEGWAAASVVGGSVGSEGVGDGAAAAGFVAVGAGLGCGPVWSGGGFGWEGEFGGGEAVVFGAAASGFVGALAAGSGAVEGAAAEWVAGEGAGAAFAGVSASFELHVEHRTGGV